MMVKIPMVCDVCGKEIGEVEAADEYAGCVARVTVKHEGCYPEKKHEHLQEKFDYVCAGCKELVKGSQETSTSENQVKK